jgi:hypothetical protein
MKILKGFVTINQFINNITNNVSSLGELSTFSQTFSTDKGEYKNVDLPEYSLITFKSIESTTGVAAVVSQSQVDQITELVNQAVVYATAHIRPYDPIDFKNTLLAAFTGRISTLNHGPFVDNGTLALPQWISWISTEHSDASIKIWLSDEAFQNQYDEYEIKVIPPLTPLNNFFGLFNSVSTTLDSITLNDLTNEIEVVRNSQPESYLRILNFNFVNTVNQAQTKSTNWTVLVYGKAGDNIDTIKDAIIAYVLENSTHTNQEWETILPDLFKRTEFIFLPRWDKEAIPNLTVLAGIYSSILNPKECIQFAKDNIGFYDDAFIEDNVNILPYDYKAISLVCVNGSSNIAGKETILDIIPDCIPISSTSTDFNRMQIATREWILLMDDMLVLAETATEFTTVPSPYRRIIRENKLFISMLYNNVNYLVAAKSNSFYNI